MEEAERLCDRIGIMDAGELKAEGTRRELVALVGEHDRVTLGGAGDLRAGAVAAGALGRVLNASSGDGAIELLVDDARELLPELLAASPPPAWRCPRSRCRSRTSRPSSFTSRAGR